MDFADFLIVGAGVAGLAIAAELAERFPDSSVVVLERNHNFGQETSGRNSEVIHAGIYYPKNSLKACLCVEGNKLLYRFCSKWRVPHLKTGKLIVANTTPEIETLNTLINKATANGIDDLQLLGSAETAELEPFIQARAAILSPSTGIIDSHHLMRRLEWLATEKNCVMGYQHEVTNIIKKSGRYIVSYTGPEGEPGQIACSWLVNSAGLSADHIASLAGIDIEEAGYRLFFCKGEYFRVPASKAKLVSRLVYPAPYKDLRGLGIHVTKSLDNSMRLGPNAFYVEKPDYTVNSEHITEFFESVKDFLPLLKITDLQPDMAGVRPKLQSPGTPIQDFVICHEKDRGLRGLINLIGIESPGLTSCLSLAKMVADMVEKDG